MGRIIVPFVIAFGVIGAALLLFSYAAVPVSNTIEPETGNQIGTAVIGTDTTASNGKYISFQASNSACPIFQVGTPPNCDYPKVADYSYIASNFDINQDIVPGTDIPASSASDPTGNFRLICGFSHLAYDDPIVYPGRPGASPHLHMFFGNTLTDGNSTYASLRTTGSGTCQGEALNRTAYWAPAVFSPSGKVIIPDFVSVYYKGENTSDANAIKNITPLPAGLRMIAGFNLSSGADTSKRQYDWYCETTQVKRDIIPHCPAGERVGVHLAFPSCWDGQHLDSADHRSHLAYGTYDLPPFDGKEHCPPGYPTLMTTVELGIWYTDAPEDGDSSQWYLSSDRMPGMPVYANGSSFHSDWFGAWDPTILKKFTTNCINGLLNCSGGQLGDGSFLKQPFASPADTHPGSKLIEPPIHP